MENRKKTFKFYLTIFLMSTFVVLAYSLYMIISGKVEAKDMISFWFLPPIFTALYYGSDVLRDKIYKKRRKPDPEKEFLEKSSKRLRESGEFLIEDFRRLQGSQKFQEAIKTAFQITQTGEDDTWTLDKLDKKFRPDTTEGKAMSYIVAYAREQLNSKDK